MSRQLLRALWNLLADADVRLVSERSWHSLTFSGTQIELSAVVSVGNHAEISAHFEQMLLDHDFQLNGVFVADIAVTERVAIANETRLVIHALLIED
jgi:hypothetical protein